MTDEPLDPIDPTDHRDELASAHLDGLTTADESAQVADDAELRARVERLGAAREALRATDANVTITADVEQRREAGIAAALAAYDDEVAATTRSTLAAVPTVRRLRAAEPRRRWQVIGIAAAVLLLALAVPLLGSLDDGSDDESSDVALEAAPEESTADRATESAAPMAGDDDSSGATGSPEALDSTLAALPHLGAVESWPELADAVARARQGLPAAGGSASTTVAAEADTMPTTPFAADTCASAADGARFLAVADYSGRPLLVRVLVDDGGTEHIQGLDPADCSVVLEIDIDG